MFKLNGNKILMDKILDLGEEGYLLRDAYVNTDEEYYEDMNNIEAVELDDLVVGHKEDVVVTISSINNEGQIELELYNPSNGTNGYVLLDDSYLNDDIRYYTIHHLADIYRRRGVRNATFYFYLWRE